MDQKEQLQILGAKAWDFRRQTGFTKSLPQEIQKEAAELASKGLANLIVARALGVTKSSVVEWKKKYSKSEIANFAEVHLVDERPSIEVRVSGRVQGCLVEITGADFSLLQRLMRKLGN